MGELRGVLEAGANACTHNLQNRLGQLGIPASFDFTPAGTHSAPARAAGQGRGTGGGETCLNPAI